MSVRYLFGPVTGRFVDRNLRTLNGNKGMPSSFALLDRLLARQAYVLAFWQTPNQGINYRRFFTISDLVGVRIGDPAAFEASHAVPLRLADKGLDGLHRQRHRRPPALGRRRDTSVAPAPRDSVY